MRKNSGVTELAGLCTARKVIKDLGVFRFWYLENLPAVNTYLRRENYWTSNYANCIGSLVENRRYHR